MSKRLDAWDVTKAGCAFPLLLFACAGLAQDNPRASHAAEPADVAGAAGAAADAPAVSQQVTYADGQLTIRAINSTLADVLRKVTALTGAKIDLPAGASSERMPLVEVGPGPAGEVLASLLRDSSFDFVIQASATDPASIQSVLLLVREKGTAGTDRAPGLNPRAVAMARPVETGASVPAPPETAVAEAAITPAQPADSTPPSPAQPDAPMDRLTPQTNQAGSLRPGAMAPPQVLNSQSISQQLRQMYQQRVQMMQPPAAPGGGNK